MLAKPFVPTENQNRELRLKKLQKKLHSAEKDRTLMDKIFGLIPRLESTYSWFSDPVTRPGN